MVDVEWIREHADEVQRTANEKGISLDVSEVIQADERWRASLARVEQLRYLRNQFTSEIAQAMQAEQQADMAQLKNEVRKNNKELQLQEKELQHHKKVLHELLMQVPNRVSEDTPYGLSDADNIEISRVGQPPAFPFPMKSHIELGEMHQLIDCRRGVKTAGSRHYYLRGMGVLLKRAVEQLAIDLLIQRGFEMLDVPLIVNAEAMERTGFFPQGIDQSFKIEGESKYLVGTSEVPLISYYSQEILDLTQPKRLAALSTCFRSEVGSAGRDVSGLYRVHQFSKVEQVILCRNDLDESERMLAEITQNAEDLLTMLELPYRVVAVCTGDMSQKTYKQFDIETWMPSREAYGETHSSSILLDFQARRSHIRYRDETGNLVFCHTLNNTAVALPRLLIPLLENHQQEDGSIYIPLALRPYMNGLTHLEI
ncbi:seryl-tRNA synthetase [Paenibacillus shirakamiensis]|uniref:Serine--tRNA ligase n=1 Tax=Paenibacillus shirakamiensis TaxID=1265935 RepID=A0ABS4JHY0_9BACL|nr:serine--tRNA ligase [Paenibacillus shirakamiensis]MBP2001313.1 seryl-tRNA synthetase [Paenibacillus shirakamiensis]